MAAKINDIEDFLEGQARKQKKKSMKIDFKFVLVYIVAYQCFIIKQSFKMIQYKPNQFFDMFSCLNLRTLKLDCSIWSDKFQ